MENKINIAELLKDCPQGMELDCTNYSGVVTFKQIVDNSIYPIEIMVKCGNEYFTHTLTKYGQNCKTPYNKCIIFPKGKTTWEGFQRPFKDGDIVTWEDRGSLVAFIYKERKDVAVVKHHFALYKGSLGTVTDGEISLVENEIVFATEEEKDKLFQAIKEHGYKWNPETKTLEMLPKFKVGDKIRYKRGNRVKRRIVKINNREEFYYTDDGGRVYFMHQGDWELVPNKFDITTLKPFESRVLVRDYDNQIWIPTFWGKYLEDSNCRYLTTYGCYKYCIPDEGNHHLLGTTNDCDEYYKTWE